MFEVESGIPVPQAKTRMVWPKLQVGESFFVPFEPSWERWQRTKMHCKVTAAYSSRQGKYVTRQCEKGGALGVRMFRVG